MSRVINTNGPGKTRNQLMRTSAELLRRLSQKADMDDEARDMAALLALCLRQLDAGIDQSAAAWEKRDYWLKSERFRARWAWTGKHARLMDDLVRREAWEELPGALAQLLPHFEEVKITKFTRTPALWKGAFRKLMEESPMKRV